MNVQTTNENAPCDAMAGKTCVSLPPPEDDGTPRGWHRAFHLAGREAPPAPTSWPIWQVSDTVRVVLADALNLEIQRRDPRGRWVAVGDGVYVRSMADAGRSVVRRGLLPRGAQVPTDARRWPYEVTT